MLYIHIIYIYIYTVYILYLLFMCHTVKRIVKEETATDVELKHFLGHCSVCLQYRTHTFACVNINNMQVLYIHVVYMNLKTIA